MYNRWARAVWSKALGLTTGTSRGSSWRSRTETTSPVILSGCICPRHKQQESRYSTRRACRIASISSSFKGLQTRATLKPAAFPSRKRGQRIDREQEQGWEPMSWGLKWASCRTTLTWECLMGTIPLWLLTPSLAPSHTEIESCQRQRQERGKQLERLLSDKQGLPTIATAT